MIKYPSLILLLAVFTTNCRKTETPSQPNPGSPAAVSQPGPCLTNQLSVKRYSDDAGVGNRAVNYALANKSATPCTLSGYPRFRVLDAAADPMAGMTVVEAEGTYFQPTSPAAKVTLAPGGEASFQIAFSGISPTSKPCPESAKVEIIPPGTDGAFVLAERIQPCGGQVKITPVRQGLPQ